MAWLLRLARLERLRPARVVRLARLRLARLRLARLRTDPLLDRLLVRPRMDWLRRSVIAIRKVLQALWRRAASGLVV